MVHYVHHNIRAKSPFLLNSSERRLLVPRRPRSAKARPRSRASATALRAPARAERVRETLEGEVRADARLLHSAPARVELPQHPLDMALRGLQQL